MKKRETSKNFRLHIGIFGRRNVGKSSILNAITSQNVSIVSDIAGTTTDPVEKPMELLPFGPVLFIDTAGIDDTGKLGEIRKENTKKIFNRTDLGIIVTSSSVWGEFETLLATELKKREVPVLVVFNKEDLKSNTVPENFNENYIITSALNKESIQKLRLAIMEKASGDFAEKPPIVADLVGSGESALLVVPIDMEAPKGRIILPQVQVIRDLLDHNCICTVVKETELKKVLSQFNTPPKLVITDSQAFKQVAAETPLEIPITSFSILMARMQGDLVELAKGAIAIDNIQDGDKILIAESCSHHPIGEDIGTVKIPKWLKEKIGNRLQIDNIRGHNFPEDMGDYKLIIHCGACMWNRREMLNRIGDCTKKNIPITNYGLTIAYLMGILERALIPFPKAMEEYKKWKVKRA